MLDFIAKPDMQPQIRILSELKLVGMRYEMSFAKNRTTELWKSFMPRRKEINNREDNDLYSLEIYPPSFFDKFNPNALFMKWAAVEVTDFDGLPIGMELLTVPAGQYAVFIHKGPASDGPKTYHYIFETWLPKSKYCVDERPHFAKMGEKYKNEDPDSEEEIWIPIKPRD